MSKKPEIELMFLGRYVCTQHGSSKFWEISKILTSNNDPDSYKISYGPLRSLGQSYVADRDEAWSKLISKLNPKKGYELNSAEYTESLRCHIKFNRLVKGKTKEAIEVKKLISSNKQHSQDENEKVIDMSAAIIKIMAPARTRVKI